MADRVKLFRLLETADNFLKYAAPGREERAEAKARKRYEQVATSAEQGGDDEILRLARIRLSDLDERASRPRDVVVDDEGDDEMVVSELPAHAADRVPPGQRLKKGWPTLHQERIPRFDPATWDLRVWGEVGNELTLSYDEFQSLPNAQLRSDFHCVTGWSKLDNVWTGVQTRTLLARAEPTQSASHVSVHAESGYTANVPLNVLFEEETILTWAHNGEDLVPKHGFPLRLVIPRLYAWKSVKWVRGIELLDHDRRGFWELRGYHNRADPWLEERYSYQEGR